MIKPILKITFICLVGWLFYANFQAYLVSRQMPDMPMGAYYLDFEDANFRGIILDAEVTTSMWEGGFKSLRRLNWANRDRQYLGVPFNVPEWMKGAWSTCLAPTPEELEYFEKTMPDNLRSELEYSRLDAVCKIELEGEQLVRGLIYSVPRIQ